MIISALISIFIFLLVLSFLVLIHELGHFLAAKFIAVKVEEFGIGYPPRAKTLFKKWGTTFTLNWIPFGGFVKIYGEEAQGPEKKGNKQKDTPFYDKSASERLFVILAGPVVNLIFGALAFSIIYSLTGIPTQLKNQARIAYISPKSPAAKVGMQLNTNLIYLRDQEQVYEFNSVEEAIKVIARHKGKTVTIASTGSCSQEICESTTHEYTVYIRQDNEIKVGQEGSLGVAFQTEHIRFYPWYQMPFRGAITGFRTSLQLIFLTVVELGKMMTGIFNQGTVPEDFRGPFGIGHVVVKNRLFETGILSVFYFSALLSVGLAIMNMLPIPALDGGRAIFILLEKIIGKHRVDKFEAKANYGGFIILLTLIVLVTIRDIWRIALDIFHFLA